MSLQELLNIPEGRNSEGICGPVPRSKFQPQPCHLLELFLCDLPYLYTSVEDDGLQQV
jgi:hypothetical protein